MSDSGPGKPWQISLRTILVFVIALGVWMAIAVNMNSNPRAAWYLLTLLSASILALIAQWLDRRAELVLLVLLIFAITIGLALLRNQEDLREREEMIEELKPQPR